MMIPGFNKNLSLGNFITGILSLSAGEENAGNILITTPNFIQKNKGIIATT